MRIRTFIFAASSAVALLFFGGSYWALGNIFGGAVRDNALHTSEAVAKITFGAMYELMNAGWEREQAESFLRATRQAADDSALSIQIYRAPVVAERFGEIEQPPFDAELLAALQSGRTRRIDTAETVRHILPLVAEEKCLRCHRNAGIGTPLGAVEVVQNLGSCRPAHNGNSSSRCWRCCRSSCSAPAARCGGSAGASSVRPKQFARVLRA